MTKTLRKDIPLLDVREGDRLRIKSVAVFSATGEQLSLDYSYDEGNTVVREYFEGTVISIVRTGALFASDNFRMQLETDQYGVLTLEVSRYARDLELL